MSGVVYGEPLLARLAALCEADPAREVCGFVVRRAGALEVVPVENVADRYHAQDPTAFPRTSRDGYLMDPHALLRIHRELRADGGALVAVWHSHVEAGAYFSARDRSEALADGVPLLAGVEHLVLGVRAGRVTDVKRFRFEGGEFVEVA